MPPVEIVGLSHIGIRVRDRERSLAFYGGLGFTEAHWFPPQRVAILTHPSGVEINLIVNADDAPDSRNILMDVPERHAGYTHVALEVESIERVVAALAEAGIAISEGPVDLGGVARAVFIRDPDRNVVELNQPLR